MTHFIVFCVLKYVNTMVSINVNFVVILSYLAHRSFACGVHHGRNSSWDLCCSLTHNDMTQKGERLKERLLRV